MQTEQTDTDSSDRKAQALARVLPIVFDNSETCSTLFTSIMEYEKKGNKSCFDFSTDETLLTSLNSWKRRMYGHPCNSSNEPINLVTIGERLGFIRSGLKENEELKDLLITTSNEHLGGLEDILNQIQLFKH